MPYIKMTQRDKLENHIRYLVRAIDSDYDSSGVVNYVLCRIVDMIYGQGGYDRLSDGIKALECAKLEFYRKRMVPYEDKKCEENSEVFI